MIYLTEKIMHTLLDSSGFLDAISENDGCQWGSASAYATRRCD